MGLHEERYRRMIERLVEVRRRLGLSQATVAQQLVLDPQRPTKRPTQSFVSKCENRERRLDPVELAEFARIYGIRVADLLGEGELPAGLALACEGAGLAGAALSADARAPEARTEPRPTPAPRPRRKTKS